MRRIITVALGAALLAITAWMVHGAAAGYPPGPTARPARAAGATAPAANASRGVPANEHALERGLPTATPHLPLDPASAHAVAGDPGRLAGRLAAARLATAKYATNLHAAKAAGYRIITRMIPDMGYHYLNPAIQGFDVTKPHILVYERHGNAWQLGALEWVFPAKPATPPLPGATYGSFGAACHYTDGTFVLAPSQAGCAKRSPQTGAAFTFWHPDLVTLHVWVWYPNPAGLYNGTNPYVQPFNDDTAPQMGSSHHKEPTSRG